MGPGPSGSVSDRASRRNAALGLATAAILLAITGLLAISDLDLLDSGGPATATPSFSPAPAPDAPGGAIVIPRPFAVQSAAPVTAPSEASPGEASPYTCEDREIRDATPSRWLLRSVLAGSRRGFERVTFELSRRSDADRPARIAIEWMSPEDARSTFGLPRFEGQRGILLTFGAQVSTTGTQLIGPVDLRRSGIGSISGVYRFTDSDGAVRAFIAIRDQACARIRAPGLEAEDDTSRRATILVDLATP